MCVCALQILQTPHPPKRSAGHGTPHVHKGFLATWAADGIRDSVLRLIKQLAADAKARDCAEVDGARANSFGTSASLSDFRVRQGLALLMSLLSK